MEPKNAPSVWKFIIDTEYILQDSATPVASQKDGYFEKLQNFVNQYTDVRLSYT